jgi:hypothetical protein
VATLIFVAYFSAGRYLAGATRLSFWVSLLICASMALALAAVRTSMLVPLCLGVSLMLVLCRSTHPRTFGMGIALTTIMAIILAAAPAISRSLGAYEFDVVRLFAHFTSESAVLTNSEFEWATDSIGLMLIPQGVAESILFLPARTVLYWIAPLPQVPIDLDGLANGTWFAWQNLVGFLAAVVNLFLVPCALASLMYAIRRRNQDSGVIILHIAYWVSLLAIAGGNLIISERYRVMALPLLFACAWHGARLKERKFLYAAVLVWAIVLLMGAAAYLALKLT